MFDSETTILLRSLLDAVCEQVGRYDNGTRAHVDSRLMETVRGGAQTIEDLRTTGHEGLASAPAMLRNAPESLDEAFVLPTDSVADI